MTMRTIRWARFLTSATLVAVGIGCGSDPRSTVSPGSSLPNIIFIVVDTLRADAVGLYGKTNHLTPNLDSIGEAGVLFERAIAAAPWTQPSIASMLSSLTPSVHGVVDYAHALEGTYHGEKRVKVFNEELNTLPEVLQDLGYETAGFVSNPFVVRGFGFAQGFDTFEESFAKIETSADTVNRAALDWVNQREKDKPLFLYLHHMDVHGPYHAKEKYLLPLLDRVENARNKQRLDPAALRRLAYKRDFPPDMTDLNRHLVLQGFREYWEARYHAGVREWDDLLGALKSGLASEGLWDDAFVVIVSDHGEELFEHRLWDHGDSNHHTQLHVPLIMRWPGRIPEGRRIRTVVSLIDVMPTVLDLLGATLPQGIQGVSLAGEVRQTGETTSHAVYSEAVKSRPDRKALYLGDWKLRVNLDTQKSRLHNIAEDPLEKADVAFEHSDIVQEMEAILNRMIDSNEKALGGATVGEAVLLPEQVKRLRELGYLK